MAASDPVAGSELEAIDGRIAARLKALRAERGWSLDELAARSGVSRATLSRLENAAVSGAAQTLGRLCAAFGITLSQLMQAVEGESAALMRGADQPEWRDPALDYRRRVVSPPGPGVLGELAEIRLGPDIRIAYAAPSRPGLQHHLLMLEGALRVAFDGETQDLRAGDCLRYRHVGPNIFTTGPETGARYLIFLV